MRKTDCFYLALLNLLRNPVRTSLTMIGVVIGSASLIVMIGLGIGMDNSINETLSHLGDLTILDIYSESTSVNDGGLIANDQNLISDEMVSLIRNIDGVVAVCPFLQLNDYQFDIIAGQHYKLSTSSVVGVNPEYLQFFGISGDSGRVYKSNDDIILFGSDVVLDFYDMMRYNEPQQVSHYFPDGTLKTPAFKISAYPASLFASFSDDNQTFRTRVYHLTYVDLINDSSSNDSSMYSVFININTLRNIVKELRYSGYSKGKGHSPLEYYTSLKIKAKDIDYAETIKNELQSYGIQVYGVTTYREQLVKTKNTIQSILFGVGLMAVIIAIIGMSNTTIMSIFERTPEIAIMKVVGAAETDITSIFIVESFYIGMLGGTFGVIISLLAALVFNHTSSISLQFGLDAGSALLVIPVWLILLSITMSGVVGMLSSLLPSKRAIRINIIDAIKS